MKTKMKEYRAKFNLTQDALAEMVDARRETIIRIEKGLYNPYVEVKNNTYDQSTANHKIDEVRFYQSVFSERVALAVSDLKLDKIRFPSELVR